MKTQKKLNEIWVENLWQPSERNTSLLGTTENVRLAVDWDETLAITTSMHNDQDLKCINDTNVSVDAERTVIIAPGIIETIAQAKRLGARVGIYTKNGKGLMAHVLNGEIACFGSDLQLSYSKAVKLITFTKCGKEKVIYGNCEIQRYLYDELISRLDFIIGLESFIGNAPLALLCDSNGERLCLQDLKLIGAYGHKSIVYDDAFSGRHNNLTLSEGYQEWTNGIYLSSSSLLDEISAQSTTVDIPIQKFISEQEGILDKLGNFLKKTY